MKLFDELAARVTKCLSLNDRKTFNAKLCSKLSGDPLHYICSTATEADKMTILKCAFMDTLNVLDLSPSTLKHIILVLFDFTKYELTELQTSPMQSKAIVSKTKAVKVTEVSSTQGKTKLKVPKSTIKATGDCHKTLTNLKVPTISTLPPRVDEIEQAEPDNISSEESSNIPSSSPVNPIIGMEVEAQADTTPSMLNNDSEEKGKVVKRKRSKKTSKQSEGSVLSAAAKKVAPDDSGSGITAWDEVASILYAYNAKDEFRQWFKATPGEVGIKCISPSIAKCQRCLSALMLAPVTNCLDVGCVKKHRDGVFPHNVSDLDLNDLHVYDTKQAIRAYFKPMFEKTLMPSILFVATHGAETKKPREARQVTHTLDAYIGNLLRE